RRSHLDPFALEWRCVNSLHQVGEPIGRGRGVLRPTNCNALFALTWRIRRQDGPEALVGQNLWHKPPAGGLSRLADFKSSIRNRTFGESAPGENQNNQAQNAKQNY